MIDGGLLKRHFSDLVSATATKNQSDITLIDPFQLVDYKTRILPEHLYPKFRLHLDKFKSQNPQIDITDDSQDQAEDDQETTLTGDQRITRAMESDNPQGADAIIRRMIENINPEDIEFPADLRNIKKPKSFNKKKETKKKKNPPLNTRSRFEFSYQRNSGMIALIRRSKISKYMRSQFKFSHRYWRIISTVIS